MKIFTSREIAEILKKAGFKTDKYGIQIQIVDFKKNKKTVETIPSTP